MTKAHSQTNRVSLWKLFPPWFIPISGGRVVQVATVECACKRSMVCCTLRHYWTVCGNQPTTCHDFSGCSPYLWHTGCKRWPISRLDEGLSPSFERYRAAILLRANSRKRYSVYSVFYGKRVDTIWNLGFGKSFSINISSGKFYLHVFIVWL